jgi:hypothetical protein
VQQVQVGADVQRLRLLQHLLLLPRRARGTEARCRVITPEEITLLIAVVLVLGTASVVGAVVVDRALHGRLRGRHATDEQEAAARADQAAARQRLDMVWPHRPNRATMPPLSPATGIPRPIVHTGGIPTQQIETCPSCGDLGFIAGCGRCGRVPALEGSAR